MMRTLSNLYNTTTRRIILRVVFIGTPFFTGNMELPHRYSDTSDGLNVSPVFQSP